jgi:hypothetical protein
MRLTQCDRFANTHLLYQISRDFVKTFVTGHQPAEFEFKSTGTLGGCGSVLPASDLAEGDGACLAPDVIAYRVVPHTASLDFRG